MEDHSREQHRRHREWWMVCVLFGLFVGLTWTQFYVFHLTEALPLAHSIFFFGLVNFNIILFLLLSFLIFRNIVKVFSEREGGFLGSSLKTKMIAAFVGFSFVPTALMFLVSVFYINSSFDRWFSEKTTGVLKKSIEVSNAYYLSAKKRNYHVASEIAGSLHVGTRSSLKRQLELLRQMFAVDVVEYYTNLDEPLVRVISDEEVITEIPDAGADFLKKGIDEKLEASVVQQFGRGNLIRVIVPATGANLRGAIVVSSFVPLSLIKQMDKVAEAYEEFRSDGILESPLKSIYLIILVLMTLVILLGATWFGFYLARHLSIPLELLVEATQSVARGEYEPVAEPKGSHELSRLVHHFNAMTQALSASEQEVQEANTSLKKTLATLDSNKRYMEVVLSHVTTGVLSLDLDGRITMINRFAERILELSSEAVRGQDLKTVVPAEFAVLVAEMGRDLSRSQMRYVRREVRLHLNGRHLPLQVSLANMQGDSHSEIGQVLVIDDLTIVLNAQRMAAWKEVAKRIAHEIKNPLTPIRLAAQRLDHKFGEHVLDPAFDESIRLIISQVDVLKDLVNEFSQFARLPKVVLVKSNLNDVCTETVSAYRSHHPQVNFEWTPDPRLPPFLFDPSQMRRALTNIIENALAAVRGLPQPRIIVQTEFDKLRRVAVINITDNGGGLPKYLKDRIFEPYVTTKSGGTGLGLAIVRRTIEDHNGIVKALPGIESGTRFQIELPVVLGEHEKSLSNNKEVDLV